MLKKTERKKEPVRVSDEVLMKLVQILGVEKVKYLYCYNRLRLTEKQLTYICAL